MCLRLATITTLATAVCLAGCCHEGYIVPMTTDISLSEVPPRIQKAIAAGYDTSEVEAVERTSFQSRCAEDFERYRFHLQGGQTITLDEDGRLAKWREGIRVSRQSTRPSR